MVYNSLLGILTIAQAVKLKVASYTFVKRAVSNLLNRVRFQENWHKQVHKTFTKFINQRLSPIWARVRYHVKKFINCV